MSRSPSLRTQLYKAARLMGNAQAAARGPTAYGKRVIRRKAYSKTNGALSRVLKSLGL